MEQQTNTVVVEQFTSEEFNKLSKKEKLAAAQKNMRKALTNLKLKKPDEIMDFFEFDGVTMDRRILKSNWIWREVNQVVAELDTDKKLELFNPKGFK